MKAGGGLVSIGSTCTACMTIKRVNAAIGLATLRLDGFCSMRAGDTEGWLISRRDPFRRPVVTINARTGADGYVLAEILDRRNRVVPGFSKEDCVPSAATPSATS